jgi:hypothetical protein
MAEYIERSAGVSILRAKANMAVLMDAAPYFEKAAQMLEKLPAADVVPVVHARWIHSRYEDCSEQFELVKCSQCNHEAYAMAFYVRGGNYCPNCGAKMDGGADHEAGRC